VVGTIKIEVRGIAIEAIEDVLQLVVLQVIIFLFEEAEEVLMELDEELEVSVIEPWTGVRLQLVEKPDNEFLELMTTLVRDLEPAFDEGNAGQQLLTDDLPVDIWQWQETIKMNGESILQIYQQLVELKADICPQQGGIFLDGMRRG
jgi:hypothetical protein